MPYLRIVSNHLWYQANEVLPLDGVRDVVLARVKEFHEKGGAVAAELKKLDKEEKRLVAGIERLSAAGRHDVRSSGARSKSSALAARFHGRRWLVASWRPRRWPRDRGRTFQQFVAESRECLRSSCRDQEISVSSFNSSSGVQMIGLASPATHLSWRP